jgi:hypothetical protein
MPQSLTSTKPFAALAEYSGKTGDVRSTPIRGDELTNASRYARIFVSIWHEEAEEEISRDEFKSWLFVLWPHFSEVPFGMRGMRFFLG